MQIIATASCKKSQTVNDIKKEQKKMILFASGLSNPVCITNAGDSRLFVAERLLFRQNLDTA